MKKILTILILLTCQQAFSQVVIQGSVSDKRGEALIGTNIYIKDSYDGASADIEGKYTFETTESGTITLIASAMGYEEQQLTFSLDTLTTTVDFTLQEAFQKLDAVVITAGSFNGSDESKQVVLKPLDIATTAGATADIAGALNTLPGTQKVGETGRLFVRGGEGRETLTFIDGMQVLNSYTPTAPNTPSRNRFSPFMFKGTSFSTGAYSAEYGQALSSALVLNSKEMLGDDRTDISLMTLGLDVSQTKSWEKSSFAGKVQYTNLSPYFALVDQDIVWENAPESASGNFLFRTKTSETGILKLYASLNQSNLDLTQNDPFQDGVRNELGIKNNYLYFNASYKEILSEKVGFQTGLSFTGNQDIAYLNQGQRDETDKGFHIKSKFDIQISEKVSINTGTEIFGRKYDRILTQGINSLTDGVDHLTSATFVETETYLSKKFVLRSGARVSINNLQKDASLLPRLSTQNLRPEKATHFIGNYQIVKDQKTFRVEAYLKNYDDLLKTSEDQFNNSGNGYAQGLDVFWRDAKTFKNVDYWISYSFLDTKRNYRNFPGSFTPTFASKHNFSFVYKQFITDIKSQIGFTYSYTSGRPFNDPNRVGFNQGKTKAYQDLSFNIAYLFKPSIIIYSSVSNVLGSNQIFGYEYADTANEAGVFDRVAIRPPARRFIFLGVFITLSKEKSLNQLPNL